MSLYPSDPTRYPVSDKTVTAPPPTHTPTVINPDTVYATPDQLSNTPVTPELGNFFDAHLDKFFTAAKPKTKNIGQAYRFAGIAGQITGPGTLLSVSLNNNTATTALVTLIDGFDSLGPTLLYVTVPAAAGGIPGIVNLALTDTGVNFNNLSFTSTQQINGVVHLLKTVAI